MTQGSPENMSDAFTSRYGPLLGGQDLYSALGYKTYSAFHRSQQLDELGVHVFKLPGRRGWFAFTANVAKWLEKQSIR